MSTATTDNPTPERRPTPTGRAADGVTAARGPAAARPSPLLAHLVVLGALLALLLPVTGTGRVWSADEGALLFQISALNGDGPGAGGAFVAPAGGPGGVGASPAADPALNPASNLARDAASDPASNPARDAASNLARDPALHAASDPASDPAPGEGGSRWTFAHPFPDADPDGVAFPIHLASWADGRGPEAEGTTFHVADGEPYIVLAKHVAYVFAATALHRVGGYGAVIALSIAATVAAAGATARLAGLVDRRAERPALWLAGLGSPLLMNAYVAWAHTPAAALVGWATWFLIEDRGRWTRRLTAACLLAGACLLRTEAPLLGVALAVGLPTAAVVARRFGPEAGGSDRSALRRGAGVGATAVAATAAGIVVDRVTAVPTGGAVRPPSIDERFGGVAGRVEGFARTWLQPGYSGDRRDLLFLVAAVLLLAAAVLGRRLDDRPGRSDRSRVGVVSALSIAALAALTLRFVGSPEAVVPGLVSAFPILFVGLLQLRRRDLSSEPLAAMVVTFALFSGAVLATQYRGGGGGEWGGRYFALGLPLGIAAAIAGLIGAADRLGPVDQRRIGGALLGCTALLSVMGVSGIRSVRLTTDRMVTGVNEALVPATAGPARADDGAADPVVVTTIAGAGRWAWDDLDRARWLRVEPEALGDIVDRLDRLGVDRFVLLTVDRDRDLPALDGHYRADDPANRPLDAVVTASRATP